MPIPSSVFSKLLTISAEDAWHLMFDRAWEICSEPFSTRRFEVEIPRRDKLVGEIDLFLATAGWDLWREYDSVAPKTADTLVRWWNERSAGKAVLVLDALSLREVPWLLDEAKNRGFEIRQTRVTGAELPADTTTFARKLGLSQRSSIESNSTRTSLKLADARTETTDLPWHDCTSMVGSEPNWFFWHHWPDHRLHDHDDPGKGLQTFAKEIHEGLTSDDFWRFVEHLSFGRELIITSDHGYAASGLFPDSTDFETAYLKDKYKSVRYTLNDDQSGQWVPPLDISLTTSLGRYQFVLGRRKWKSAGGYPTLTHGGLSVLEVAVPFIEIARKS